MYTHTYTYIHIAQVYNLTDVPSILSADTVLFLDLCYIML